MLGLIAILLVLLAALAAGAVFLSRLLRGELGALQQTTATELGSMQERTSRELAARNSEFELRLQGLEQTLNTRLAATSQTTTQIHDRLGQMTQATGEMIERAKELGKLEQALRPPKARGGFGELLLENLLRDRLPPEAYDLQYTFETGERVDAVIRAGGMLLPVDAKFPLDNFERMAATEGDEQKLHEKAFARDVKGHIDAIASKYVRPDLGTFDLAFMYLPAESIHYELVSGKTGTLLAYAHERRVFPVSATTFSAYLQMIVLGLKGMQIEQRAEEVMRYCAALQQDFGKFKEDFDLVGTHLSRAHGKYADAEKRLDRFETKLDQAADEQAELDAEPPRALDAA